MRSLGAPEKELEGRRYYRYITYAWIPIQYGGLVAAYTMLSHVRSRFDRFMDPSTGDSYQVSTALEAFLNGGLFGRGGLVIALRDGVYRAPDWGGPLRLLVRAPPPRSTRTASPCSPRATVSSTTPTRGSAGSRTS